MSIKDHRIQFLWKIQARFVAFRNFINNLYKRKIAPSLIRQPSQYRLNEPMSKSKVQIVRHTGRKPTPRTFSGVMKFEQESHTS